MKNNSIKIYYLPPTRSISVGIALTLLLVALLLIGLDTHQSIWDNLQSMILDFRALINFVGSFMMLIVKIGLIKLAIHYFKNSGKVERARIDNKGFYYKDNVKSRYEFLTYEWNQLKFISFTDILDISLKSNFWLGDQVLLSTLNGQETITSLGVLKQNEKTEIVAIIKSKLNKTTANKCLP